MAFPEDPKSIHVEAAFGASLADDPDDLDYTELTPEYVKPNVVITRGFTGDVSQAPPAQIEFGLRNPAGIFSPRNLAGPHYGELRRNTPIRVSVDTAFGTSVRAFGYIPSWPVRWTGPDIEDRIETTAAGALQRLQVDRGALSALRRTILGSAPAEYWPLEDDEGVALLASGVANGTPIAPGGNPPQLGVSGLADGASAAMDVGGTAVTPRTALALPAMTTWSLSWVGRYYIDSSPTAAWLFWLHGPLPVIAYVIGQRVAVGVGSTVVYTNVVAGDATGDADPHHFLLTLTQNGSNVDVSLSSDGTVATGGFPGSATLASTTNGSPTFIEIGNHDGRSQTATLLIGHLAIFNGAWSTNLNATPGAVDAYAGELAGVRFARLCEEASEHYEIYAPNGTGTTEPMGAQPAATLPALLDQCADTEEGLFLDDLFGRLLLITRDHLYSTTSDTPAMTLDYEGDVSWMEPDDDDRDILNLATVARIGGTSATSEVEDGPLGTDRDTGVGPYPDTGITRSLELDSQAANHANWLTHMGTVDEQRHHVLIDLYANPSLVEAWIECDIGSHIRITNPPQTQTGPEPLELVLVGYREVIDATAWFVEMWLLPNLGYRVLEIETGVENASRVAADSVLAAGYDEDDTSLSVTSVSAAARWIDSTNFASQFPILIKIAGERMLCTAIAGTGATQTFTVTRGYDGVTKELPSGSEVQVDKPAVIPL